MDKNIKFDCPFCGERKENIKIEEYGKGEGRIVIVRCPTCDVQIRRGSKGSAINAWNRRI